MLPFSYVIKFLFVVLPAFHSGYISFHVWTSNKLDTSEYWRYTLCCFIGGEAVISLQWRQMFPQYETNGIQIPFKYRHPVKYYQDQVNITFWINIGIVQYYIPFITMSFCCTKVIMNLYTNDRIILLLFYQNEHLIFLLPRNATSTQLNEFNSYEIRGCIQKISDWPSGARTANGTALCH